ncbi:MAG: hypothetical protein IJ165_10620 [Proteobacteria bacterium]|nr:hypothetical protein [Pseudomonadota bacterium]
MNENSKRRLAFACCAAMALAFAGCGDDGAGSASDSRKTCGDEVCTPSQTCVENHCVENEPEDPCAKCDSETQICEEGVCKDKPKDPEDPCAKCDSETQICEEGVCKDKPAVDPCAACGEDQECVEGVCQDLCGGELCTGSKVCNLDTQKCEEPVNPCDACTDKQECINLECVDIDPCANKTCQDGYRCDREKDGACVEIDPCEGITCGDEQTCIKAHCIDNACLENGVEKDCGENMVCSKGECVDDGCQDKTCEEGWQCKKGECVETACIDYFCDEGRSCKGGKCVDNECLDMTCEEGQICSKGNCTYEICLTKDPCSAGKTCDENGECVFIVSPAITLDEPEDKVTDEAGKSISLTLHLNNAPTSEVRVVCDAVTESPNKEIEAACDEIVFNADNWQLEQTIVVKGVDDYLKDGDQAYKLKVTTVSEDADFNALVAESVDLTNIDMTKAGIVFSQTALTTYEDQEQPAATFTVKLTSIPSSDVSLTLNSSNDKEGVVTPTTLKFTKENWGAEQTVTVQGKDDEMRDGNINYTVFFAPAESNDEDYAGMQPSPIKVTNIDNDVAGLNINIPAEDYEIIEGQDSLVVVKLNTQPKNDVKVSIAIDNVNEAVSDTKEVVLNAENWKNGVNVRLTGVRDYVIDGDKPVKITFTSASEDEDYNLEPVVFDATVKDMDKADLVVSMGDAPVVKEGDSGMVTMSVSLASKPTKDVTVALSVTDPSELKINKQSLTFKPEHWDIGQDVLVSSVDDDIVDGNIKSKVVMQMTSGDNNFKDKTKEVEFTTVDDDVAGFLINSNSASFPEGSGATTSMKVSLQSQPTADVKVTVSSTDASELQVTSASTLTFTTSNWKTPQEVSVKVVDDHIADGTQTAQVKFVGASSDANFNGITGYSALYTITDDDAPSIVLTSAVTTIPQASPSTVASVALGIEPTSNVTVTLVSDHKAITFSPSTLTFTTANWDKAQEVKVNADFSGIATASATANITAKATASNSYNSVVSNAIALNLVKVPEVQNFAYTGKVQSVSLPKGKYKLEVWGAQGGGSGNGGKGGYSVGTVTLGNTTQVYVYVGGQGTNSTSTGAGWNGGGYPTLDSYYGGGGGTDIRIGSDSLYSRVIVAGGGGGYRSSGFTPGGGGGLTSFLGTPSDDYCAAHVATISNAGESIANGGKSSWGQYVTDGSYGQGGSWISNAGTLSGFAGGGGGWYGGGAGHAPTGGSGWVYTATNYTNWKAGNAADANKYTLSSVYYLENAQTTAGNASLPLPSGGTETGHTGNGYARITLVK